MQQTKYQSGSNLPHRYWILFRIVSAFKWPLNLGGTEQKNSYSALESLPAVNNLSSKPFFFIWKVWFVTVKQSKEQHHKIPCLNGKWEYISQRPDQVTVGGKREREKKKEQQALLDFVWMTPMFSAVPENELWSQWETLTVPTTHMVALTLFCFFYSAFDVCLYLVMNKI